MIPKQLDRITNEDLEKLIENSVSERKTIEYKSELKYGSDSERKEFLADVSSFANASGGDLIYGIDAPDGIPTKASGIRINNIDSEVLKIENIIRDGLEPRISVLTHNVNASNGNVILILRIKKSWLGPHRVIFKGHDKFYARNSAGKFPLDTSELRSAFVLSQALVEKINSFKTARILDLSADNTPMPFYDGGKIVLHIIPFESFNPDSLIGLDKLKEAYPNMVPMRSTSRNQRINLEGILSYSAGERNKKSHSYVQLYRSGIIEAVEGLTLSSSNERKTIPSEGYEKMLINSLSTYLEILKNLSVNPSIAIFLTLIGVRGYRLASSNIMFDKDEDNVIDKNILNLPESIIETYGISTTNILRPIFDLVWNACGFERSLNFNEQGEWVAK